MKFSEVIARTVTLIKWGRTVGGSDADRTSARTADPPAAGCGELRQFLLDQSPVTIYLLTAVAYLGGGEYEPGQLVDVLLRVSRKFPTAVSAVDVLAGRSPLAEYLSDGLRKLTAARVNLDRLHGG